MSDYAIRVEGLGKRYRIGAEQAGGMYRYKSLRDSLGGLIKRPMQAVRSTLAREPMNDRNSFWALNDVNFDVKRGEVVGIIGRNGAGKSTLLKILSRITKPTTGHIELRGRVGSLLEVGTGFHPELSGRENIYLNGAVLGMTRAEVKIKFDEIVAFSDIEKFLDTPVKQYSSGMYARLAFAVAAHLDPEILVVDEVLAVGDAAFQRKCLGKLKDVAGAGRTVLFVSHNMPAVRTLCTNGCVLEQGRLAFAGPVAEAVDAYSGSIGAITDEHAFIRPKRPLGALSWMTSIELRCDGVRSTTLNSGGSLELRIDYDGEVETQPTLGIVISTVDGVRVVHSSLRNVGGPPESAPRLKTGTLIFRIEALRLTPGQYEITLWFGDRGADYHILTNAMRLQVDPVDTYGSGRFYTASYSYVWSPFVAIVNGVTLDSEQVALRG